MSIEDNKQRFIELYNTHITREGADKLLEYMLEKSDFFTAPASTRYHGSYEGGLLEHSLNVYDCLKHFIDDPYTQEKFGITCSDETVAIVSLLHDLCKMNFYTVSQRNVKGEDGVWRKEPYYSVDDKVPYGHGEKSVYIITGFMRLTRQEAFAIRFHMGFSGDEPKSLISSALNQFPLAVATHIADMQASMFIEK